MRKQTYFILSLVLLLLYNCKATKTIKEGKANFKLSTRQLIKENAKQEARFKTLQSRLKITFVQDDKSQTHVVNFRAKKDEMLWMNASFSLIRAIITPEKVSFYNKLDNTYFDGDFKYLSDLLGTELDFQKVQNLLFGEALFTLKHSEYTSSVDDESYIIQPKEQRELFEIFFLLNPSNFKVKSQQISQPKAFRNLQIDYLSYQQAGSQILPEQVKVIAVEANKETVINLEFKSISLNEALRFPFKIPSGFDKIELK
jgi:outer membrane biogenesis lipoprotein LolB